MAPMLIFRCVKTAGLLCPIVVIFHLCNLGADFCKMDLFHFSFHSVMSTEKSALGIPVEQFGSDRVIQYK